MHAEWSSMTLNSDLFILSFNISPEERFSFFGEGKVLMWLTRCCFEPQPDRDGAPGAFKCASWPLKLSALCRAWQVAHAEGLWRRLMQMATTASRIKTRVFFKTLYSSSQYEVRWEGSCSLTFPSSLQRSVLSLHTTSTPLGWNEQNKTAILTKRMWDSLPRRLVCLCHSVTSFCFFFPEV